MDSQVVRRCTVTWLPNFLGWAVYHIFLPMVLCCVCFARESSTIKQVDEGQISTNKSVCCSWEKIHLFMVDIWSMTTCLIPNKNYLGPQLPLIIIRHRLTNESLWFSFPVSSIYTRNAWDWNFQLGNSDQEELKVIYDLSIPLEARVINYATYS